MNENPQAPSPRASATAVILIGMLGTFWFATGGTASELARQYAIGVGVSLLVGTAIDFRGNLRNLVRTDVMALAALYFLTLSEFLFEQPLFDDMVSLESVRPALLACLVGFGGIVLGRHASPDPTSGLRRLMHFEPRGTVLVTLFAGCFFGGYIHMLLAVNFDVGLMLDYFMAPRFSQPWGRGRFGDWKALLYELGMVLYLVPPIAGVIIAKRQSFSPGQVAFVLAGFLFTVFYGFSSGTRNILATYLATFLVAYAFTAGHERRKEVVSISLVACIGMFMATTVMLDFRNIGLSRYLSGEELPGNAQDQSFFVDYNLYVISQLIEIFPESHDFLGWEIPYLALVRPIPRAVWSSKPEGLSMSIEEALGVEGLTLASTFVGEAYISGGFLGIAFSGLAFGMMMAWWNKLGRSDNSPFGHLLFASGFFAAVISMRSMLVFTTAILPTIAALLFGHWAISRGLDIRRRHREGAHDE